jgi:hypothetical protein
MADKADFDANGAASPTSVASDDTALKSYGWRWVNVALFGAGTFTMACCVPLTPRLWLTV